MGQTTLRHPISLLFAVVSIVVCVSAFGPKTQELIDTICRRMEDYGFCNKCFSEHISTPETDMHGLAQIAIEQSLKNATATLDFAKKTLREATDQQLVDYLKTCIGGYLSILKMIEDAENVFRDKNYSAVLTDFLSSAKVLAMQCGQYSNSHGIPNPLYEDNREERILITMAAATAYSLVHGEGARH
ncbi:PMEI domain-containing protein [Psidium guajava]|nr:PMEI domain-containing protein [Psidium guajava]